MTLPQKFLNERYEKAKKYIKINDQYAPNYRTTVVTCKFYSIYEALDLSTADPEIVKRIKTTKDEGPKEKYPWSLTENQMYGWFLEPLIPRETDGRFYFPKNTCDIVKMGLKLKQGRL